MRLRCMAAALAAALLAGCHGAPPPPASQYRLNQRVPPIGVSFAPGAALPPPGQLAELRAIMAGVPEQSVPVFYGNGPWAGPRAAALARALGRPVALALQLDLTPEQGVLAVPYRPGIVASACDGPGGRMLGDIWPGDDRNPARLLPPGCATEADLAAQVTRPSDLLRGRELPPGAALPYARAIEQYYHRNDAKAPSDTTGGGGSGGGGGGSPGGGGSQGGAGSPGGAAGGTPTDQSGQQGASAPSSGWGYAQGQNPLLGPATH